MSWFISDPAALSEAGGAKTTKRAFYESQQRAIDIAWRRRRPGEVTREDIDIRRLRAIGVFALSAGAGFGIGLGASYMALNYGFTAGVTTSVALNLGASELLKGAVNQGTEKTFYGIGMAGISLGNMTATKIFNQEWEKAFNESWIGKLYNAAGEVYETAKLTYRAMTTTVPVKAELNRLIWANPGLSPFGW